MLKTLRISKKLLCGISIENNSRRLLKYAITKSASVAKDALMKTLYSAAMNNVDNWIMLIKDRGYFLNTPRSLSGCRTSLNLVLYITDMPAFAPSDHVPARFHNGV